MRSVLLWKDMDQVAEQMDAAVFQYVGELQTESFEAFADFDLLAFDWYDVRKAGKSGKVLVYIDREDLFRLSSSVDDLADYAWTTVKDLRIYEIQPDEHLTQMAGTLLQMADGLLICMENLEKNQARVYEEATRVKKLENTLNVQFHRSIAELFASDDLKRILKYREIYSHMNHASDKGDASADILLDIIVKF